MLKSLLSSSGLSLRLLLLLLALTSIVGCTGNPLSLLTGGGPNVAANTQLGQQNTQTIGKTEQSSNEVTVKESDNVRVTQDKQDIKSEKIDAVVVNNTTDPKTFALLVALFVLWSYLLYMLPSPDQIWKKKR
jgi:predicted PurR-regulated permease PerM